MLLIPIADTVWMLLQAKDSRQDVSKVNAGQGQGRVCCNFMAVRILVGLST